jgi:hypothetical protein
MASAKTQDPFDDVLEPRKKSVNPVKGWGENPQEVMLGIKEVIPPELVEHICPSVEIEVVLNGALMRLRFEDLDPREVVPLLRAMDPGVKFRDAFPMKGGPGRETKKARVLVINARVTDSGKFIDVVAQNGDDISVSVSRKNADGFVDAVKALNRLGGEHLAKLEKAFADKGTVTIILKEPEQFGVAYWVSDDGRPFAESFEANPPALVADAEKGV